MKCRNCPKLFVGTDENKNEVYVCFPTGKIIEDLDKEIECVFRR